MDKKYFSVKEVAESWEVSDRRIVQLCNDNLIEGAKKIGGRWKIPSSVKKPEIVRYKKHKDLNPNTLLPVPIGNTSFKEVTTFCYYVDKTLLIKKIIDEHNKVTLFTRPRRFGKTLTKDMLKTFFEKTHNDTSTFFYKKAIWSCGEYYRNFQGKYPVIFLSFKDALQKTWDEMYQSLCLTIEAEFERHSEILDYKSISDTDKNFFKRAIDGHLTAVEFQASIGKLSHILSNAFGSRIIVIIDEYDTPIQNGFENGYYEQVIHFIRNLFSSVLKDNTDLEFGILTGILRVAQESLFSGLNNIIADTILDDKYSQYFGFTPKEVETMCQYYGKTNKLDELRQWYDGYLFGCEEIYNPWSVICYLNNDCSPKAFWSRTSSNDMIIDLIRNSTFDLQQSLMLLLQNKPVQALIDTDIIYPKIGNSEDSVLSFLLMTGYLKISNILTLLDDNPLCELVVPNKEIKFVFKKEVTDNLSSKMKNSIIRNFQLALVRNSSTELEKILCQYLIECASSFDTAKESFYHGLMLGLLAIMSDEYRITSNRETGEGRFDIQLLPYRKTLPGMIMEFKAGKEDDRQALECLAQEAINQIKEKKYITELKADGISQLQAYGIAFCKKKAIVSSAVFEVL